jgi:adenylate cyclase
LRFSIGFILVAMILVTGGVIAGSSFLMTRKTLLEFSRDLIARNAKLVQARIESFMQPVTAGAEMSLRLARAGMVDVNDVDSVERYFFDFLSVHPSVAMINWGDEQGNFLMVKRVSTGALSTKLARALSDTRRSIIWKHRVPGAAFGEILKLAEDPKDYDCRTRPWYTGAKQAEKGTLHWTDVYVFFSDQMPGITVSAALYKDDDNELLGVLSLDVALVDLSHFLRDNITVGRTGQAVILDPELRIVAMPQVEQLTTPRQPNGPKELRELAESPSPEIAGLANVKGINAAWLTRTYTVGEKVYLATPAPITVGSQRWTVVAVAPEDDFLEDAKRSSVQNAVTAGLLAVASLLFAALVARLIARPLGMLAEESDKLRELQFEDNTAASAAFDEVARAMDAFQDMKTGLRAFQKYVPTTLVRSLITERIEPTLGGEVRELSLLFTDIRGFTGMSERIEPLELSKVLAKYLSAITDLIHESSGTVDKYVGDAVVAFWGAPQRVEDHAVRACRTALQAQKRIAAVEAELDNKYDFTTRIGINTAKVVVGNFGSTDRLSYTAIGDGVNLASRLEGVNKYWGTKILISEETRELVKGWFVTRRVALVSVKGRSGATTLYELVCEIEDAGGETLKWITAYEAGLASFLERDWSSAAASFEQARSIRPDDRAAEVLLEQCTTFQRNAPPSDWNGVIEMMEK